MRRRDLIKEGAALGAGLALPPRLLAASGVELNDVQSRLNLTRVARAVRPTSIADIRSALTEAARERRAVSIAGGRHAMGGQQFGHDAVHLDMSTFNRVLRFDRERGLVSCEAGIEWPDLIAYLHRAQQGVSEPWAIREKQTGVDRVSLGGTLAANAHGRGLRFPPIVGDVESLVLLDAEGRLHACSRRENRELFALAIGGYGLFGVIVEVTLRLVPRTKVERVVEVIAVKDLVPAVDRRIEAGFVYGDCQYSTDLEVDAESHPGVFSCYRPVPAGTPIPASQKALSAAEWAELYLLARSDKKAAFERYSRHYLATGGQIYWSDTHQLAGDFTVYQEAAKTQPGTEMITEVYVTRAAFAPFLTRVRQDFLEHRVDMTYGTIRFIERDEVTFLPWATERSVCIVCNLHVVHTEAGIRKAMADFRRIIDRAIEFGGRFYLTYHRWATREQVAACYPQFAEFLRLKLHYDPRERFQSEWYRHHKTLFEDGLPSARTTQSA